MPDQTPTAGGECQTGGCLWMYALDPVKGTIEAFVTSNAPLTDNPVLAAWCLWCGAAWLPPGRDPSDIDRVLDIAFQVIVPNWFHRIPRDEDSPR